MGTACSLCMLVPDMRNCQLSSAQLQSSAISMRNCQLSSAQLQSSAISMRNCQLSSAQLQCPARFRSRLGHVRRANCAGPRRRFSCQPDHYTHRPGKKQLRRRRSQGSGTAAGAVASPTKHPCHPVVPFLQHVVVCVHFTWVLES